VAGFNLYRTPGVCEALDEVRIVTCYSGVVVEGPARVLHAADHEVILEVGAEQAAALARARLAIVESPVHGTSFRACVATTWPAGREVRLTELVPFKEYIGRRRDSRVVPVHPMLVRLSRDEDEAFGRVVDVSSSALATIVDGRIAGSLASTDVRLVLDVWGEIDADPRLPDFSVNGRILRIGAAEEIAAPFLKVVVAFDAYPALDTELKRYTARRQREVMVILESDAQAH
jgi:hypothetical protein